MKIVLFSDIHSNLEAFTAFLAQLKEIQPDKTVFLGDLVGYGASPNECFEMMEQIQPDIWLLGNHDAAIIRPQLLHRFQPISRKAAEWTIRQLSANAKRKLWQLPYTIHWEQAAFTHGSFHHEKEFPYIFDEKQADLALNEFSQQLGFVGHTHCPLAFSSDGKKYRPIEKKTLLLDPHQRYIINPGSIGQPRDGDSRAAFLVWYPQENRIEWRRYSYPIESAAERIQQADLPEMLANRLRVGH